jgi:hypothetical protein
MKLVPPREEAKHEPECTALTLIFFEQALRDAFLITNAT